MKINSEYEILTPSGFKDFYGIRKVSKNKYIELEFSNNSIIKCSFEHPFIQNKKEILAKDLKIDDNVDSKNENIKIINKKEIFEDIELFDFINVEDENIFYVNDIVSHNCDADFLSSGNSVIAPQKIKYIEDNFVCQPIRKTAHNQDLWIWEMPLPNEEYIVSADVARGDGSDYSAFHVLKINGVSGHVEQVAEFKSQISTREFAHLLFDVAKEYNFALLAVENANIGWDVVQELIQLQYPNLYYTNSAIFVNPDYALQKSLDIGNTKTPGWTTSGKTRPLLISKLETYFEFDSIIIKSQRTVDELFVFKWIKAKAQSEIGYNDDLVLSLSIGLFIRDASTRLNKSGLELSKAAIEATCKSITNSVLEEQKGVVKKQYTMSDTKGNDVSIGWLINFPKLK